MRIRPVLVLAALQLGKNQITTDNKEHIKDQCLNASQVPYQLLNGIINKRFDQLRFLISQAYDERPALYLADLNSQSQAHANC